MCSSGAGALTRDCWQRIERHQSKQNVKVKVKSRGRGRPRHTTVGHVTAQDSATEQRTVVHWYHETRSRNSWSNGCRPEFGMEKRLLKVLKAFAEYHDLTLGDLLEGIVLHAFDGKTPFSQASLEQIKELKKFYGLELDSSASHRLKETKRRDRNAS